jgi:hypothetical protein
VYVCVRPSKNCACLVRVHVQVYICTYAQADLYLRKSLDTFCDIRVGETPARLEMMYVDVISVFMVDSIGKSLKNMVLWSNVCQPARYHTSIYVYIYIYIYILCGSACAYEHGSVVSCLSGEVRIKQPRALAAVILSESQAGLAIIEHVTVKAHV